MLSQTLFNAIAVHLDVDHTVHPPLIIDANEDEEDNTASPASVDENIDPKLDKLSSGKKLKGKRKKANDSDTLIAILQERYAFEDERNNANREAEEERESKRQRIAFEKDERWFDLFAELVRQK